MDHLLTCLRAQWDRAAGVALISLGAALIIAGWIGVSGAATTRDQLSYLASGGLGGLFCLGAGVGLLVSANLSDEWRKLDELTRAVERSTDRPFEVMADISEEAFDDERLSISGPKHIHSSRGNR